MQVDAETKALLEKRMASLVRVWGWIQRSIIVDGKQLFTFNHSIASKAVLHYAKDLDFLKRRYNIPGRVQTPKIAGLMANAILKYRPLVPMNGKGKGVGQSEVNEFLAVYFGLCVCANYEPDGNVGVQALSDLMKLPLFYQWFERLIYLLRERNYTSEALIMVFETLCVSAFQDGAVDSAQQM